MAQSTHFYQFLHSLYHEIQLTVAMVPQKSFKDSSSTVGKEVMAAVLVTYLFLTAPELRISWLSRPSTP